MPLKKAKQRAKDIEQAVLDKNGITREFTNKEVYLLLLDNIDKKIDEHLRHSEETLAKYIPLVTKHTEILEHIMSELPDKGFCTKQQELYDEMHPEGEESIPDKVKTLWYDRKIMKYILATSIGALIVGIVTLGIGFLKGVF